MIGVRCDRPLVSGVTGPCMTMHRGLAQPARRCMMVSYMLCLSLSLRRKFLPASQGPQQEMPFCAGNIALPHSPVTSVRTAAQHAGAPSAPKHAAPAFANELAIPA